jgi:hypothetical protein
MQRAAEKAQVDNSGVSTSGPGENERASTTADIEYQEVKMNGCVAVSHACSVFVFLRAAA